MIVHSLSGPDWRLSSDRHAPVPATVPGCVHDALIAAGVLVDPDHPGGEDAQAFVGHLEWTWSLDFEVDSALLDHDHVELCLDSVDTVGVVELNDQPIATVESQFVPHRIEVGDRLLAGPNRLVVRLRGTLEEARRREVLHGPRPVNADGDWGPFSQLRKSACNFGWDWGPRCPTCGFAGDVRIEAWSGTRIAAIRTRCRHLDPERAELAVEVDLEGAPVDCEIVVRSEDGRPLARARTSDPGPLVIDDPPVWWPRGLGGQPMVTVSAELPGGDTLAVRTGLRTTRLVHDADGRFALEVNGEPVFCRGANWIPSRLFPHAQVPGDVEPLLEAACEANMNMVRVWGGGLYEPDWFYEACDRRGLMVWQDFMFACATYPEHASFRQLVEQEVRAQVRRLAHHPSIVVWCGGNEDLLAWHAWGWRERMDPGTSVGIHYWTELIPGLCAELDPDRPYWVESPWSGSLQVHPNDPDTGDRHVWDLRLEALRTQVPRFASEFGHQSPPCPRTVEATFGRPIAELTPPDLAVRQRGWGGDEAQYAPHLEAIFGAGHAGFDLDRWIWACQLVQARAMRIACSWFRANQPRCEGALVWQLNDVWTGHSWSLVDVHHRRKPAFHAVREAFEPLGLFLEPVGGRDCLVVVNATDRGFRERVRVERVDFEGRCLAEACHELVVPARRGRVEVELPASLAEAGDPAAELVVARVGERSVTRFFLPDRACALPEPAYDLRVEGDGPNRTCLELTARSLLRDAMIDLDGMPEVRHESLGLFTLLPGERRRLLVPGRWPGDVAVRLRTANELVH